ncbi:uncharacterized protein LJ206_004839 isoform 2-T2 [Theristicus caerulescens]
MAAGPGSSIQMLVELVPWKMDKLPGFTEELLNREQVLWLLRKSMTSPNSHQPHSFLQVSTSILHGNTNCTAFPRNKPIPCFWGIWNSPYQFFIYGQWIFSLQKKKACYQRFI